MADLLQVTRGTSATVRETFYLDGAPSDLDGGVGAVPVVTITRPDGTTIASGTVTRVSTGLFSFVLAAQPLPTILDVIWVGTIGGQVQTLRSTVEVIGAELFTVGAFRALKVAGGTPFGLGATPLFSDAQIHQARTDVLDEMTNVLGFSPVPRYQREVHSLARRGDVVLGQLLATQVLSVSVAGVAQTPGNYLIDEGNRLLPVTAYTASPWTGYGYGDLVVEYTAGWPRPKGNGSRVAMIWAAALLNPSLYASATTVSTADGETYTYEPSEVGRSGFQRHTGIRVVDRWLNMHAQVSAGVA